MPVISSQSLTVNDPLKDSYFFDIELAVAPSITLDIGASLFSGQKVTVLIKQNTAGTGTLTFGPSIVFDSGVAPTMSATPGSFVVITGMVSSGVLYAKGNAVSLTPQPANQIVYGWGTDISSSSIFTFDPTSSSGLWLDGRQTPLDNAWGMWLHAGDTTAGTGFGQAGSVELYGGKAWNAGTGGNAGLYAGEGPYGGNTYVYAGTGNTNNGGTLELKSGTGTNGAGGGQLLITAGGGSYSGDMVISCDPITGTAYYNRGGRIDVMGGRNNTTGGVGGPVVVSAGYTTAGSAGSGGALWMTPGDITIGGNSVSTSGATTPAYTASAAFLSVKEVVQAEVDKNPFTGNWFGDVSTTSCSRRVVISGQTPYSGPFVQSLPFQVPITNVWTFKAQVVVNFLQSGSDFAAYEVTGVIANVGGTITIYNPVTTTMYATAGAAAWTVVASIDAVNKALVFTSNTGVSYKNVVINVDITQAAP